MSLIQEALKRQRDDSAGGNASQPGGSVPPLRAPGAPQSAQTQPGPPPLASDVTAPPLAAPAGTQVAPPPLTDQVYEETEAKSRSWITLVGVILVVLILGAGGVWLLIFAFQKWGSSSKSEPVVATQSAPGTPGTAEAPAAGTATPAVATPTPGVTDPVVPPVATPVVRPPGAAGTPPANVTTAAGTPGIDTATGTAWPYLRVTALAGKGLRGAATINGKVLSVGDFIDGAEVVSIGDYGVRMEFEGESRFVRVGSGE